VPIKFYNDILMKSSNYQDLLKILAILFMTIDHIGFSVFKDISEFRIIGRLAAPLFCFFAGYNFHNKLKHELLCLGVVLFAVQIINVKGYFINFNILISIYLGQCYIYLFEKKIFNNIWNFWMHLLVSLLLSPISALLFEYGTIVWAIMILGYGVRRKLLNIYVAVIITIMLAFYINIMITSFNLKGLLQYLILSCILYLVFIYKNFESPITVNVNIISRNALPIYCFQIWLISAMFNY
jgi:hypothetical protein